MHTRFPRGIRAAAAFAILIAGCGGSESDAATIDFSSTLIIGGEMPIPRDPEGGTPVGIVAKNAAGGKAAIDLESLECESSDETLVAIESLGELLIVTALADRFDSPAAPDAGMAGDADAATPEPYGVEPEATVTCTVDELSVSVTVRGVVDATGTWLIEASGLTDEVAFEQTGRELFVPGTTAPVGRIDDGTVTLMRDGITLVGTIDSRTEVHGMLGPVEWRAKKQL